MTLSRAGSKIILLLYFVFLVFSAAFSQSDTEAKNMAAMKKFYDEVVNQGKMDSFDSFFADNFVEHEQLPTQATNREGVKQFFMMFRKAFPDLKFTVNDIAASGDKVWVRITMSGTQNGPFMDMPASGKKVSVEGFDLVRFVDGKAAEHWGLTNDMAMMTQLGAMPAPPEKKK